MRHFRFSTPPLVLLAVLTVAVPVPAESDFPSMRYEVDPDWPLLPPGWNFGEVAGVAADNRGHVFVFHRGEHPIMEFAPDGRMVRSWGEGLFIRPHAVRVDPEGNIWTVDNDTHQVLKMDSSGRVRMVVGRHEQGGETEENFNRPTDVAFAPNGDFYVSDGYVNSRVVRFSKEGRYITAWGKKGDGEGEFNIPHTIAVDRQGRVYVGDRENYRVQIFDPDGNFLTQWRHVGAPWGLELRPDDTLFIADGYNDRILKVTLEGKVLGAFGTNGRMPGELNFAHHLAIDPSGNIFVSEIKNQRAQKFSPR
jgi:DNA-binding beta-propeller fold protein YncE